jgi:hypothetical protein
MKNKKLILITISILLTILAILFFLPSSRGVEHSVHSAYPGREISDKRLACCGTGGSSDKCLGFKKTGLSLNEIRITDNSECLDVVCVISEIKCYGILIKSDESLISDFPRIFQRKFE